MARVGGSAAGGGGSAKKAAVLRKEAAVLREEAVALGLRRDSAASGVRSASSDATRLASFS